MKGNIIKKKNRTAKNYHLMKICKTISLLMLMFVALSSCKDDIESNDLRIIGQWDWIQSVGGFGGWTLTPETEGETKSLKITDTTFSNYSGDSLVFQSRYSYRYDTLFGYPEYLEFENGGAIGVNFSESRLELIEMCFDCYIHYYERQ